jgi:hypothetical protein
MGLKDAFLIPLVYLFRTALILITPICMTFKPFEYHSLFDFGIHSIQISLILLQAAVLRSIFSIHCCIKFFLGIINLFWLAIIFWPVFFYKICTDPNGRSIKDILSNSRNTDLSVPENNTKKKNKRLKPPKLRFYNRSRVLLSTPQSQGAYAHIDEKPGQELLQVLLDSIVQKQIYFDDPLRLSVPYEYIAKKVIEPPDGLAYDTLAFLALVFTFLLPVVRGYLRLLKRIMNRRLSNFIHRLRGRDDEQVFVGELPKRNYALATKLLTKEKFALMAESSEHAYLTSWDSDGIFFCVDNSATCIICNDKSLFVGDFKRGRSEVLTSNGVNTPFLQGTLRLVLQDNAGKNHQYDIPDVLYDPESPFNLLGLSALSKFFGDCKTRGTRVESACYDSTLVWDNGKHERRFPHGLDCLPLLQVNVGESYYKAFCTRVSRFYNDNVKFGFRVSTRSKKVTIQEDVSHPVSKRRKLFNNSDFELGMELIYKDGRGSNVMVVYEGATAHGHIIKFEDGSTEVVDASHLLLLHQPDLTNLPSSPEDYQKEIRLGYLPEEDAIRLARPKALSPIQQLLMAWHHRLYHLPFRRMFMLAEKGWLPRSLLKCKDNVPLCVACQFGTAH